MSQALRLVPIQATLFGVAYFALARGGLTGAIQPEGITSVWLPSGLYLGILLATPRRRWPAFVGATFAADVAAHLVAGTGVSSLGIGAVAACEGPLAALATTWFAGSPFSLMRMRHIVALALGGAGAAAALVALGGAAVSPAPGEPFWTTWVMRWTADAIGMLAVAPLVWALLARPIELPGRRHVAERCLLLAALGLCAVLVFSAGSGGGETAGISPLLPVPILLWLAWRSGPIGTAIGSLVLCVIAALFTVHGLGPFSGTGEIGEAQLLSLQAFLGVNVVSALGITAAVGQGREAKRALREAEQRFRTLVEQIPTVTYICDYDENATPRYISPQFEAMTGYTPEQWLEDPGLWKRVVHPDDRDTVVESIAAAVRDQVPFDGEYRMIRADGRTITVWDRETIVRDDSGLPVTSQGVLVDVTELRRAERALVESEDLHRSVVEVLEEGVFVLDAEGTVVACNASGARALGREADELIGSPPPFDLAFLADGTPLDRHNSPAMTALRTGRAARGVELRIVRADGEERWLCVSYQPLGNGDRGPRGLVWSFTDVTDRRHHDEEIAYLAYHDGLTGLPNRAALQDALTPALARARRSGRAVALIYLDLDYFKVVNDSLGHAAGDEVLRQVADRLRERVREGDLLARLSGDEFMLLLPDLDADVEAVSRRVALDLIAKLESPFTIHGSEFEVTASAGVALFPQHGERSAELLKRADAALYETKRTGRGTVSFYSHQGPDSSGRLTLSSRVRRGLARDEFELHYQPIFSLAPHEPIGVESLIRWRDPGRGLVMPGEFIPMAEETGVIDQIGDWVIDAVLAQGEDWLDLGLRPLLGFNVSPRQLHRRGFAADLARKLEESRLDPWQISVEITESAAMADPERSGAILASLHEQGVQLAIDDFGADYSSLGRLSALPLDMLKLDRSFLRGAPEDPRSAAIVRAIIHLAEALDMRAVAEGVETEAQRRFLIGEGCPLAQGFHLARPAPADQITALLLGSASPPPQGSEEGSSNELTPPHQIRTASESSATQSMHPLP